MSMAQNLSGSDSVALGQRAAAGPDKASARPEATARDRGIAVLHYFGRNKSLTVGTLMNSESSEPSTRTVSARPGSRNMW